MGAGRYTRRVLIPDLQSTGRFEIAAVCNRTEESARSAADELGVGPITTRYEDVIGDESIDAVLVGTQPAMHREIAIAALDSGKHVLCQTRLAADLQSARDMVSAADRSHAVAMLVPPDSYVAGRRLVKALVSSGELGAIREVFCVRQSANLLDASAPMLPRQNAAVFGRQNPLHLGLCWDVLAGWFGRPMRVVAHSRIFTPTRYDPATGEDRVVELPDAVTAISEMENGAVIHNIQSGVARAGKDEIVIHGELGTLVYHADETLEMTNGDGALVPLQIPAELTEKKHTGATFADLIEGREVEHLDFSDGLENMMYLEACHISASEHRWVEFSEMSLEDR